MNDVQILFYKVNDIGIDVCITLNHSLALYKSIDTCRYAVYLCVVIRLFSRFAFYLFISLY